MRTFEITQEKEQSTGTTHFMYREYRASRFNHFPDYVKSRADITNFLTNGGRLNEVQLIFADNNGKPAKYYSVKKKTGNLHAIVDGADVLGFNDSDFITDTEILEYFKTRSEGSTDTEATDKEKISLYKRNASNDVLEGLQKLIESKQTDEAIKALCQAHAKQYFDCPAYIDFE